MKEVLLELAKNSPTGLTMVLIFVVWMKWGRNSNGPLAAPFDLVEDRNRNWETHAKLETRLGKVENRVTAVETEQNNQKDLLSEMRSDIKEILRKIGGRK